MPYIPFALLFITLLIFFNQKSNLSLKKHIQKKEEFLNREREANFSTKKKINEELFLKPNGDILPFYFYEIDENNLENVKLKRINKIQKDIQQCLCKPMIKLSSDISNTELKEMFGYGNLENLIDGEHNYNNYIKYLNNWSEALMALGKYEEATIILQEALEQGSDVSLTYTLLITTYYNTDKDKLRIFIKKIRNRTDYPISDLVYKKIISHYDSLKVN